MACYLQSGIQTQWNIWDGDFYRNNWRAVSMNNFRNKIHLIFYLRGSEFDSDLKHSDKEYIYLTRIYWIHCVVKAIYKRIFLKKKHFTPNKESSFLMSLFLSFCFSFQTRTDLVLLQFYYNAEVRRFLKTLENLLGDDCDGSQFSKV